MQPSPHMNHAQSDAKFNATEHIAFHRTSHHPPIAHDTVCAYHARLFANSTFRNRYLSHCLMAWGTLKLVSRSLLDDHHQRRRMSWDPWGAKLRY